VETIFGLEQDTSTDRLIRRRTPLTVPQAAADLAEATGLPPEDCNSAIRAVLRSGAKVIDPDVGRPVFAFRLHQFLSKGDNVYATIETPASRYITSRKQVVSPDSTDTERKLLLPLAFCRECGQEYLIVRRTATGFESRDDTDASDDNTGYLYISDDQPWPDIFEVALGSTSVVRALRAASHLDRQARKLRVAQRVTEKLGLEMSPERKTASST
jgi:hypothetical protein